MWVSSLGQRLATKCSALQLTVHSGTLRAHIPSRRYELQLKSSFKDVSSTLSPSGCQWSERYHGHVHGPAGATSPVPTKASVVRGNHPKKGAAVQHQLKPAHNFSPASGFRRHPPSSPPRPYSLPSAPVSPDPRSLLRIILHCDNLGALLLLIRNHELSFNVRHLDAALDRLGRLAAATTDQGSRNHLHVHNRSGFNREGALAIARAAGYRLLLSVLLKSSDAAAIAAALTPRDCASLLSASSRLELRPPLELVKVLQSQLLAQLPAASVRDVAQLMHACTRLRLALPEGAMEELLRHLDGPLAAEGTPQDVSMVLWSLASRESTVLQGGPLSSPTSPSQPPSPGLLSWLSRLTAQLPPSRLVTAFPPQALSNSAWALAKMGFKPPTEWLGALVEGSGSKLEAFSNPELVNLMWALAVVRHRPPRPWLGRALGLMRERAGSLTPQDVSNLCWSLAVLEMRPGLPLLQRLVARALALRKTMGSQNLIMTLWALTRLGVQLPERAVALLVQGGMGAMALYGISGQVASSHTAFRAVSGVRFRERGGGGERPRSGEAAHVAACSGVATAVAVAASPGELSGVALVLARCRYVPPRRWLVGWYGAVLRQLHLFGPRELSTLMYGIGRLRPMGLCLESHWLDQVLLEVERLSQPSSHQGGPEGRPPPWPSGTQQQQEQKLQQLMSPQQRPSRGSPSLHHRKQERLNAPQLAVVLWAVARLGYRPPASWVAALAQSVAARVEEFGPQDAAITIRALQQLAPTNDVRTPRVNYLNSFAKDSSGSGSRYSNSSSSSSFGGRRATGRSRMWHLFGLRTGSSSNGSTSSTTTIKANVFRSGGGNARRSCEEAVAGLVARLATILPHSNLYGALRAASLTRGCISYATVADELLTDVYSVKSLGLLQSPG